MPITIPAMPFTFASESGNQPASQLDTSFSTIRNALTGVALQASDLAAALGTSTIKINSTTQLQLNQGVIPLLVGGVWTTRAITAAVTFSPTISANTTYFIYATDSGGTTILENSVTTHATDPTFGVEIKSGDNTRTLVGMVRSNNSNQLVDSGAQRFSISWFNRKLKTSTNNMTTGNLVTSSTSFVAMSTTLLRTEFLAWADEEVFTTYAGTSSSATQAGYIAFGYDGTTGETPSILNNAGAGNFAYSITVAKLLADGYHTADVLGKVVSGGTLTLFGSTATGDATAVGAIRTVLRG